MVSEAEYMPKSLTINNPESKMGCDTLVSLQAEYQRAVREFTKSVKKVHAAADPKTTQNAPLDKLSDPERVKCGSAHRALRNHIIEHGCC
jgi:hypothetical protein